MPEIIIDEDLRLASPTLANAEELHAVVHANLPHLSPWLVWATEDYDLDGVRKFIGEVQERIAKNEALEFSIFYQGRIIGGMGFVTLSPERSNAEVGYWIDAAHEGQGLVVKTATALIDHAFENLEIDEVYLRVAGSNQRSRSVAERLGFTVSLVNPGAHQLPGGMDDLVIYSLNKNDRV